MAAIPAFQFNTNGTTSPQATSVLAGQLLPPGPPTLTIPALPAPSYTTLAPEDDGVGYATGGG